ncbi:MAG: GGDEF domain-containing response regulator [Anaerolineae bacterium]
MAYDTFKVLIIDDDDDTLKLYGLALGRQHYEILEARSGQEGLEYAFREEPDVILLDLMMPGMDGYEVCRRLRTAPKTADLPILILTNLSGASARQKAHELGADDFITKGEPLGYLDGRIKMLIKQRILAHTRSWLADLPGSVTADYVLRARLAAGRPTAVCHLDIHGLSAFNERAGVEAGDRLLWTVARLLRDYMRENTHGDFTAYCGQDDFLLIMDPARAPAVAQSLVESYAKAVRRWADGMSLSMGIPELYAAALILDGSSIHPASVYQRLTRIQRELKERRNGSVRVERFAS